MGLKHSYTLLAPLYDAVVKNATASMRKSSLQRLQMTERQHVLINGIGTGLDLPYLPTHHQYTATDLTPAMLKYCQRRLADYELEMQLHTADVMQLPFTDNHFDIVQMNLILAVVPQPLLALQEAVRVLKPGGKIFIMDKFLKPGETATLRKAVNLLMRHIATRTDVVFEELLAECPQLELINDKPALLNGWFRLIDLEKKH
ncbi:MAG TPA: class I SAM-dependent methyltransferase [Gammaproteobacteria bacterium]